VLLLAVVRERTLVVVRHLWHHDRHAPVDVGGVTGESWYGRWRNMPLASSHCCL
jgi:hypothetical protein